MSSSINAIRVSNPHVGTRDGLEFTATINNSDRPCFITGTALAILGGDLTGSRESVFNARIGEINQAVSRKSATPDDEEIVIDSGDVQPPA